MGRAAVSAIVSSVAKFSAFVLAAIFTIALIGAAPRVAFAGSPLGFQPKKILSFGDVNVGETSPQQMISSSGTILPKNR